MKTKKNKNNLLGKSQKKYVTFPIKGGCSLFIPFATTFIHTFTKAHSFVCL